MGLIFSDIPELEGSDTETVLADLAESEAGLEVLLEKRIAYLTELAYAIRRDGGDPDLIKSIVLSVKSDGNADSGNVISNNRHFADAVFSKLSLVERMSLLKEIAGEMDADDRNGRWLDSTRITVSPEAKERIAYMKNSYTDVVYMKFASHMESPRAAYFNRIGDVCESVYSGKCEFCLLPIETSGDGKLLSFYESIFKYGLKINAVYDLMGDENHTRYAILSLNYTDDVYDINGKYQNRYLELAIKADESPSLEELLCAASFCSLKLVRVDTLSVSGDKNVKNNLICPVFKTEGGDVKTFFAYLTIDCPEAILLGSYMKL